MPRPIIVMMSSGGASQTSRSERSPVFSYIHARGWLTFDATTPDTLLSLRIPLEISSTGRMLGRGGLEACSFAGISRAAGFDRCCERLGEQAHPQ